MDKKNYWSGEKGMTYLIINERTKEWHVSTMGTTGIDEICIDDFDISSIDVANPQHYKVNENLDGLVPDVVCILTEKEQLAREERDRLLLEVDWRFRRYHDEETLGLPHIDDILKLTAYTQALRDVPEQQGFPTNIIWPVLEENDD